MHTPLIIGALRPGMVITDMIVDRYKDRPAEWKRAKKIFNIIADRVENVTPWLARQIIANQKKRRGYRLFCELEIALAFLEQSFHQA
ncbi:MAG: hypothetical protein JW963_26430 [Anaerolineales bacterium]|nr:hypothetical protein [Anaerolineales bacterium]